MDGALEGFMGNSFMTGSEDYLSKEFDSLAEELFFEGKSEGGEFSIDLNWELSSKRVNELIDFVFGVLSGSIEWAMSGKTGDGAVVKIFLSASCFDDDGDAV